MTATDAKDAKTYFVDVDLASNVKDFIATSTSKIVFVGDVKDKIDNAKDTDFLMIKKSIGSDLTFHSVDIADAKTIKEILFK